MKNTNEVQTISRHQYNVDKIANYVIGSAAWTNYDQNTDVSPKIGFGLISKMEVKNFLTHRLSLCFTIRPEFLVGYDMFPKGSNPVFSGVLGFTEFQVGLKFRFVK